MVRSRVLLAVSGTLQDGFELRANLDHAQTPAILVGSAVVRGVRAYADVKEAGAREHAAAPAPARCNPACVVTGERTDANLYALYLVDERALVGALLGEPRYLAIAPDTVRVDLRAPETSPAVRALLRAAVGSEAACEVAVPTVVATYAAPSFVPMLGERCAGADGADDGYTLTRFPEGLAGLLGGGGPAAAPRALDGAELEAALRGAEGTLDPTRAAAARAALGTPAASAAATIARANGRYGDSELASLVARAGLGGVLGGLGADSQGDDMDGAGGGSMGLDANGEQLVIGIGGGARGGGGATRFAPLPSPLPACPAGVSAEAHAAAVRLLSSAQVAAANEAAAAAIAAVWPVLARVRPAWEAIHGAPSAAAAPRLILHAGPPLAGGFGAMCGPMRGAITGAIIFEGWAPDAAAAEALAASGAIAFEPCHTRRACGPMSGVISPSMPVWVCVDGCAGAEAAAAAAAPATAPRGHVAFSNLNEGLGQVLRFGAHSDAVIAQLRWMADALGPALDAALQQMSAQPVPGVAAGAPALHGLALRPILGAALGMGDEGHNRCKAITSLLLQAVAPAMLTLAASAPANAAAGASALTFMSGNAHFGLNAAMAACKLTLDRIAGVPHCTICTALCRNGINFGVRVAGSADAAATAVGDAFFEAPSPTVPSAVWFAGYSAADACLDLGDSAITETLGFGAPAMAAAPALMAFVGGTAADSLEYTRQAEKVYACGGLWEEQTIPSLDWAAMPMVLDVARVVLFGQRPAINTGIAHKQAGVGQIGAGMSRAPLACFEQAVLHLAAQLD